MTTPDPTPQIRLIAHETIQALGKVLDLSTLEVGTTDRLRKIVTQGISRGSIHGLNVAWNAAPGELRGKLIAEIGCQGAANNVMGVRSESNLEAAMWTEWYPGLNNDSMKLGEIQATLPGFDQKDIPKIVRLFENPESPVALPGAVTLKRHDAIHFLLGRGLLDQDEAFVLGFTIGTDRKSDERDIDALRAALGIYPEPYQIREEDVKAFDLGVRAGRISKVNNIAELAIENDVDSTLGELRAKVGIDSQMLREFYRLEQQIIPGTPSSVRLPV